MKQTLKPYLLPIWKQWVTWFDPFYWKRAQQVYENDLAHVSTVDAAIAQMEQY